LGKKQPFYEKHSVDPNSIVSPVTHTLSSPKWIMGKNNNKDNNRLQKQLGKE